MATYNIYRPDELSREDWQDLQALQREGFKRTLDKSGRSDADIDHLVSWGYFGRYYQTHLDPNMLVSNRYNPDQEYFNPSVAVAKEGNEPIGFAYAADNVSGPSVVVRHFKHLILPPKNYLWLREIAVRPASQGNNHATQLGKTLLEHTFGYRPVTAYVWPAEETSLMSTLERYGFDATGSTMEYVFGADSEPTEQVRMKARSVRSILDRLRTDISDRV